MIQEKRQLCMHATETILTLLDLLIAGDSGLSVTELARQTGCSRTETRFLLLALESRDLVVWDADVRAYRPGTGAERLARLLLPPAEETPLATAPAAAPGVNRSTAPRKRGRPAAASRPLAL